MDCNFGWDSSKMSELEQGTLQRAVPRPPMLKIQAGSPKRNLDMAGSRSRSCSAASGASGSGRTFGRSSAEGKIADTTGNTPRNCSFSSENSEHEGQKRVSANTNRVPQSSKSSVFHIDGSIQLDSAARPVTANISQLLLAVRPTSRNCRRHLVRQSADAVVAPVRASNSPKHGSRSQSNSVSETLSQWKVVGGRADGASINSAKRIRTANSEISEADTRCATAPGRWGSQPTTPRLLTEREISEALRSRLSTALSAALVEIPEISESSKRMLLSSHSKELCSALGDQEALQQESIVARYEREQSARSLAIEAERTRQKDILQKRLLDRRLSRGNLFGPGNIAEGAIATVIETAVVEAKVDQKVSPDPVPIGSETNVLAQDIQELSDLGEDGVESADGTNQYREKGCVCSSGNKTGVATELCECRKLRKTSKTMRTRKLLEAVSKLLIMEAKHSASLQSRVQFESLTSSVDSGTCGPETSDKEATVREGTAGCGDRIQKEQPAQSNADSNHVHSLHHPQRNTRPSSRPQSGSELRPEPPRSRRGSQIGPVNTHGTQNMHPAQYSKPDSILTKSSVEKEESHATNELAGKFVKERKADREKTARNEEKCQNAEAIDSNTVKGSMSQLKGSQAGEPDRKLEKQGAKDEGESLPEGWSIRVSKTTGKQFYYHSATKRTQWNKPEA